MSLTSNKFLVTQVWIRNNVQCDLNSLEELSAKLHERNGVRVTWNVSVEVFADKPDLVKSILRYCDDYGDDFSFDLGMATSEMDQQTINATIDECMTNIKQLTGRYPKCAAAWHMNAETMSYLNKKYGVEIVSAQVWEQYGVDGLSCVGSINGPFYPSASYAMSPARDENNRLDVVMLDTLSCDPYETKVPKLARSTVHPWDSNLTAGDGVVFQKYIADSYFTKNADRNSFSLVNLKIELDWINWTDFCYNTNCELKKRVFEFWDSLASDHSDVAVVTMSEFNDYYRRNHKNNDSLLYRYHHKSKYEQNTFIYWYFNKNHAIAVEYRLNKADGPETITLNALDFQGWRAGYDVAEYDRAAYPATRVRTTPYVNDIDRALVNVTGGKYTAWILCDGTAAGDIEVLVGGKSFGTASGTRGIDGWCKLGDEVLTPGEQKVEVIHRHNPQSNWYAAYVEVLLTQEPHYVPPKNRIIDRDGFVAVTNFVVYDDNLREPVPPTSDWSVTNGLNWKHKGIMSERFIIGDRYLATHSQADRFDNATVRSADMGITKLYLGDSKAIPFELELLEFSETKDTVRFTWRFTDGEKELLKKSISITSEDLIIDYDYSQNFDRLEIEDAFGEIHTLACPAQVIFRGGRIQ